MAGGWRREVAARNARQRSRVDLATASDTVSLLSGSSLQPPANLRFAMPILLYPKLMDLVSSSNSQQPASIAADTAVPLASQATEESGVRSVSDDAALMLRYRNGDARAFEMLYARHKAPLYRYLLRTCRNKEVANDLFQEVWGKVIASRSRYEARAQFTTFLYRIAHNCAIDYFRRSSRERSTENLNEMLDELPDSLQQHPESIVSEVQLRADFRRALDELPSEQRDVFVLYEETGLSLEEIGKVTGVAMETAKSRLRYAVAKLRVAMEQHQPASAQT
jgi:RNA polymerase sigma-70 factor, ECF subfamily